jgi:hypothetical protein
MVINRDYIREPKWSAEILAQALRERFSEELKKRGLL